MTAAVYTEPRLFAGDVLSLYSRWPRPTIIVSDGAYGVRGFPGDPPTAESLVTWYEPHIAAWTQHALPSTTLWFWNTELGWATVHPALVRHGWEYRSCHVWDKGIAHAAGNSNTRTLRKFPVVSEVCVQYVRDVRLPVGGVPVPLKTWLRHEWRRAGLPLQLANTACGVANAATRKYFTACHLWYFPPPEAFARFVAYANRHGDPGGRPYFSFDGKRPATAEEWAGLRAKFRCEPGVTNVWREPAMHGEERLKRDGRHVSIHANQKPLALLDRIVRASSDPGDVVWEPFGGLCSVAVAASRAGRLCCSAERSPTFYRLAVARLRDGEGPTAPRGSPRPASPPHERDARDARPTIARPGRSRGAEGGSAPDYAAPGAPALVSAAADARLPG
jgi:site-specific DNA-methyltransferase (adenine-specific)